MRIRHGSAATAAILTAVIGQLSAQTLPPLRRAESSPYEQARSRKIEGFASRIASQPSAAEAVRKIRDAVGGLSKPESQTATKQAMAEAIKQLSGASESARTRAEELTKLLAQEITTNNIKQIETLVSQLESAVIKSQTSSHCGSPFLPAFGCNEEIVLQNYGQGEMLAAASQVNFIYGFRQQTRTVQSDLASLVFPNGLRIALGASVTGAKADPAPATPGAQTGAPKQAVDSVAEAVTKLKAGGDFYLSGAYPLLIYESQNKQNRLAAYMVGKMGFNFAGLGSDAVVAKASDRTFSMNSVVYGEYGAIKNTGSIFAQYSGGYQYIQPELATQLKMPGNFYLGQVGVGIRFAGMIRVSMQRFYGPSSAYDVANAELRKWHLVLQFDRQEKEQK